MEASYPKYKLFDKVEDVIIIVFYLDLLTYYK